ncbi:actin [Thecamonas trahens ATCC 50062]|uniref:Actin n=1 Tax=Thecamonas trahens ATCC 50062 TaxID=461836 RepID=A0A0L0DQN5_THETB|nr:actin [Thecamonas trahens ATCC 50062]KNC54580.1 actin [Thecamonas trahens ATCC 50062]|eukprot:XP_013761489.1 actin [Thecamonas trahens ATCC 50062]
MDNRAVFVVDTGSRRTKAGLATGHAPSVDFLSTVTPDGSVVGDEAAAVPDAVWPVHRGSVRSWEQVETLWRSAYAKAEVESAGSVMLVAEQTLNTKAAREHTAQIMFESLDVHAGYICVAGQLALFAAGKTSGVVVESGAGVTTTVPIYDGFPRREGMQRIELAGEDATAAADAWLKRNAGSNYNGSLDVAREFKHAVAVVAPMGLDVSAEGAGEEASFELPDGTAVTVPYVARALIGSSLFDGTSSMGSVQHAVAAGIETVEPQMRDTLYATIVMSGGNALTPGSCERLQAEVKQWAGQRTAVAVSSPPDPVSAVWHGGVIVTTVGVFKKMCVTKIAYAECGPNIIHRKCL